MTDDPVRFIWNSPGSASRELQAAGIVATTCAAHFGYQPGIATFPNGAAVFLFPEGTPPGVVEARMRDMGDKAVPDDAMLGVVFDGDKKTMFVIGDSQLPNDHVRQIISMGHKALHAVGLNCIGQMAPIVIDRDTGQPAREPAPAVTPIGSDSEDMN